MKSIAIAATTLVCIATPAIAQDNPGTDRWEGVYVGINAGSDWIAGDMTAHTPYNSYNGFPVLDADDSAVAGGFQIGYNHQMNAIGIGGEAVISFTSLDRETDNSTPGSTFSRGSEVNASIGPRLTVASGAFAIFGKGGLAMTSLQIGHDQNGTLISSDELSFGYMLGGGAEYALSDHFSLGVQYEYQDYGSSAVHIPSAGSDIFVEPNAQIHALRAMVNYRF